MQNSGRVLLTGLLAALLLQFPVTVHAQLVTSIEFDPARPTPGDPVTVITTVLIPQDCGWEATAAISFGPQIGLEPVDGWGLDLVLAATRSACDKPVSAFRIEIPLGTLPVAAGPGILRLEIDAQAAGETPFSLTVDPGPAPGWRQPALHESLPLFLVSAGMAAVSERLLAVSDLALREITVFDPVLRRVFFSFRAPGLSGLVRGLAFDGTDLFASVDGVFAPPRIFQVGLDGVVVNDFPSPTFSPFNRPLEGLAFHDGVLYGTHESPPFLFAIDPVSGRKLWQRSLPVRILGLTAVPEGLLGFEPNGTLMLIEPSPDGTETIIGDDVDIGFVGIPDGIELTGLAYDGFRVFAWDARSNTLRFIRPFALWWALDGTLQSYVPEDSHSVDVIRGNVNNFHFQVGNTGLGPTTCMVRDGVGGAVPEGDEPPLGEAHFYLARFNSFGGFDTSYGRSSFGFRRREPGGFFGACF